MFTEETMRKDEEYEMQLFGFNSRAVCATVERIVEEKIQMNCKKLSMSLNKIYKPDENDTSTLRLDVKGLIKAYHSNSHHHVRIMKKCIRKWIAVPRNILLKEDECQAITYSQETQDMEKHLTYLQARARKAMVLQAALNEELRLLDKIWPQCDVVKIGSTLIENSLKHPEVDAKMIKCVSNCHVLEDVLQKSHSEADVYTNDTYIKGNSEPDLDTSHPKV